MRFLTPVFTLLVAIILIATGIPVSAASKVGPSKDPTESATVNIYCRIKLGGNTLLTTGTGVFISERGVILTNAHVGQYFLLAQGEGKSKGTCSIRSGSPARDQYSASLLYISPKWIESYTSSVSAKGEGLGSGQRDFALLYVTKAKKGKLPTQFPTASIADASTVALFTEGSAVSIIGYPAEKKDFKDIRDDLTILVASSTISGTRSFERPHADILVIAPSLAGQSGVSGAPVSQEGKVIALVTTLSNEKAKNLKGIRAITLAYIDRIVRADSGVSLTALFAGDFAERARLTQESLPPEIRKTLETTLRRVH